MPTQNIHIAGSGVIYRNPKPHVFSRHAYFPWVVSLDNGDLLASFVLAEAFEAIDSNTYTSRSSDMGLTWSEPISILNKSRNELRSNCSRLTALENGNIVTLMVRANREDHPEEGLANPENMGFVPTELLLIRSVDNGNSWTKPEVIIPPLIGPAFEACSPIVVLKDGRWLWPTSTWRGWDGYCPNGMKMVALVSYDKGKTWPEYLDVMDGTSENIIYWEGKIIELANGALLSVSWVFDEIKGADLQNHSTISYDKGNTWTLPAATGIYGQTIAITELADGSLCTVYRRMDNPGLWVNILRLENDIFIIEKEYCLWGGSRIDVNAKKNNMVHEFNELKFGAPCVTLLADNSVFIAFWCYENMVSNIKWFRLII